ncbi:hypothetical protein [Hyalangium sp.]|uniref:IS66 family transposase n=1 Tax=Hyalangium sp. TaxID=2028555 RepID=UPI002D3241B4|nr:hypothetical protein [Hyalangium sp.]HYH96423.1 hypothetical protein [Hyalangium sp.]
MAERERVAELSREQLRAWHERLRLELELLRRRLFVAKAERIDTRQLELEFAATLAALDRLSGFSPPEPEAGQEGGAAAPKKKKRPKGRRDLRQLRNARLDSRQLAAKIGPLTVPPPLLPTPKQEAAANGPSR